MKANELKNRNHAAEKFASLSRRRFLRGLGAGLALPAFESLRPFGVGAEEIKVAHQLGGASASGAPVRMAFVYFPNGAIPDSWWPTGEGKEFELSPTLKPLAPVKDQLQIISGLDCQGATPGRDGAGDHARASGSFLTGVRVKKTAGSDIHANISIDQVAANQIGHLTRFPSLELTCDYVRKSGNCDSGYSCAYQYNLAWRSPTQPLAPEPNPRLLFERLFGAGSHGERNESFKRRQQQQRSILDFVRDDAQSLQRQLSARDKQKLDDYLTSVREIEQRIQRSEGFGASPDPLIDTPAGIPQSFGDYIQIMYDMMLLAFQTDSTRIATFLLAYEGSNRTFKDELGFAEGHHYLTHHQRRQEMVDKVKEIDLWYVKQFARFLQKLKETKDLDGNSLLHNSMIVYGSGNADGNRHSHVNLPIVLAGGGGGALTQGRYWKAGGVPITNMYLTLIDRLGVKGVERHGDSTGRLDAV